MTGVRPNSSALRIFLVEDHRDSLDLLWIYLEHSGYVVLFARSKAEALRGIPNANYFLLSNIDLPYGNGWDLNREAGKSCPAYAILMSGFGTES